MPTESEMEEMLKRGYAEYRRREEAAGREPISEHRWIFRKLSEEEEQAVKRTKKKAKTEGTDPEYLKYRRERISKGRPFLPYQRWKLVRGD